MSPTETLSPRNKRSLNGFLIFLLILVSIFALFQLRENLQLKANPEQIAQEQTEELIEKVGRLYALPQDETPTVATVVDPEKLREQAFFAHAEEGDKVLIYTKAGKAILYSPSKNQIIEVAPVNLGDSSGAVDTEELEQESEDVDEE